MDRPDKNIEKDQEVKDRKNLPIYCGFYCGDCLSYTSVIACATKNSIIVLEKYKSDQTAKTVFPGKLKDHGKFRETLEFMTGLKCDRI